MADRQISIRLAVIDGGRAKAELRSVGGEGQKSLERIAGAGRPARARYASWTRRHATSVDRPPR